MKNRIERFILIGTILSISLALLMTRQTDQGDFVTTAPQPNILFILADDLGYGDLGVTGHPYARTPHVDQLAREGIRFEHAYMSSAWCSPSRSALMSGVSPARNFNSTQVLPVDSPNLTALLKETGYATAHYGKWHVGSGGGAPPPADYGIDESFTTQSNGPGWGKKAKIEPHHRENSTDSYVDLAIDFMSRHLERPFFINLWVQNTHSYINPTPAQLAVYRDLNGDPKAFTNPFQHEFLNFISKHGDFQKALRAYCADVTALDNAVGRLLGAVTELGLADNTIIIFSSDNGPGPIEGWNLAKRYQDRPLLFNSVGSAGPYRGRKGSLLDGGIHVPLIVRWPERIPAGTVDGVTVFGGVDLLPTLAALVGSAQPEGLDGDDLSAALLGVPQQRREPLFWNDRPGWSALRDKHWKAHLKDGQFLLFDLVRDPLESKDVAEEHPAVATEYLRQLHAWEASIPATASPL